VKLEERGSILDLTEHLDIRVDRGKDPRRVLDRLILDLLRLELDPAYPVPAPVGDHGLLTILCPEQLTTDLPKFQEGILRPGAGELVLPHQV